MWALHSEAVFLCRLCRGYSSAHTAHLLQSLFHLLTTGVRNSGADAELVTEAGSSQVGASYWPAEGNWGQLSKWQQPDLLPGRAKKGPGPWQGHG